MKRPKNHVLVDISKLVLRKISPIKWIIRDKDHDYGLDR